MHDRELFQLIFPSYGDYKLPVYIWMTSLSVKLIGVSEIAARMPSALIGILQIVLVFQLVKVVFSESEKNKRTLRRKAAMIAMTLAITPWSITFSRTGFEGHTGQFFLTLGVYFLFKSKQRKAFLLLASAAAVVSVYSYFSVRYVWPIVYVSFFLCSIDLAIFKKKNIQTMTKTAILPLLWCTIPFILWGLCLLPMIRSPLYAESERFRLDTDSILKNHDEIVESNRYRSLSGNTVESRIIYHRWWLTLRELMKNYSDHLDFRYLFLTGDPNSRHGTGAVGIFSITLFPFLFFGIKKMWENDKRSLAFLIIWWLAALLPASVPTDTPHALRSINALSPLVLIVGYGVSEFFLRANTHHNKILLILKCVCLGLITLHTLHFIHDYFSHYPSRSAYEWQDGYKQTVEVVMARYPDVSKVWMNQSDTRLYLWFMIYGGFTPDQIQTAQYDTFYLKKMGKISTQGFPWGTQHGDGEKIIVISDPGRQEWDGNWNQLIRNAEGVVIFEVAEYLE